MHVIEIISLNPEMNENVYSQNYELSGVKIDNEMNGNKEEGTRNNTEILLDEKLNTHEEMNENAKH